MLDGVRVTELVAVGDVVIVTIAEAELVADGVGVSEAIAETTLVAVRVTDGVRVGVTVATPAVVKYCPAMYPAG